jgi:phosphatidylglycerophosphate synthase
VRTVHLGPVTALPAAAVVLAVLATTVGLGPASILAGSAVAVATWLLVEHGMRVTGLERLGPANSVTLVRAAAVAGVTALVVESWSGDRETAAVVLLSTVGLVLDFVDGQLARSRGWVTELGAAFDMETDAFLILVLSVYVVPLAGAWVLLIGLARYLLLLATVVRPWLAAPTPSRHWAKVVAAVQGVVLVVVASGVLPPRGGELLVAVALALLVESFVHQVVVLHRRRFEVATSRPGWAAPVADGIALAVLWLALTLPPRPDHLSWAAPVAIPLELVLFLALARVLPAAWGRFVAVVGGLALTSTFLVTVLDLGFYEGLDRPFDPLTDPSYLHPGLSLLGSALGGVGRTVVVSVLVAAILAAPVLCVWAALRARRSVARAPRLWGRVIVGLAVVWAGALFAGTQVDGVRIASAPATTLVTAQVDQVRAGLHAQQVFDEEVTHDPYADAPARQLLTGLRGKDVLVVFVESYGKVALDGSWFAPSVEGTVDHLDVRLSGLGFSSRSAWLGSPTFGGISWLAHSTLQSGLWVDSQRLYDRLLQTNRFTLAAAFHRAGWRTVDLIPSDPGGWPEGQRFYGYDRVYGAGDLGYVGPHYGYARVPDQFTMAAFDRLELRRPGRGPVMAEIDLDSSHTPWTSVPHVVPWQQLGDGSVFTAMKPSHSAGLAVFHNATRQQGNYARSIRYSLSSLVSFVRHADDPNLVMVVLGDHQPNAVVSGFGGSHDVPVSLVAHDPQVLRRIDGWGWTPGLRPGPGAAHWPMSAFRDRFLGAFGDGPASGSNLAAR